jgi:hypothetical protein
MQFHLMRLMNSDWFKLIALALMRILLLAQLRNLFCASTAGTQRKTKPSAQYFLLKCLCSLIFLWIMFYSIIIPLK